ncbi:unnamed protein product [Brassica oleracea]
MKRVKINVEKGTHADTILHHLYRLKVIADQTKAANHRNQPGNKTITNETFQRLYWKFGTPSATPSTLLLVHRRVSIDLSRDLIQSQATKHKDTHTRERELLNTPTNDRIR